jgi:hypothetical protein
VFAKVIPELLIILQQKQDGLFKKMKSTQARDIIDDGKGNR